MSVLDANPFHDLPANGSPSVNRSIAAFAFAMILLGLTANHTRADLIITAGDVTVTPGGIGTMDFTVTSDSNDTLSAFSLGLNITVVGGTSSLLPFTTAQPVPYGNPNYVFSGESINSDLSLPSWSLPYQTNYPSDTIVGGDSDDGSTLGYVTIPSTAGGAYSYLGTVQFQAAATAPLGDQFQISLVNDPKLTYFNDQYGDPLNYSSNVGLVTIVSEPASLALLSRSSVFGLLGRRSNSVASTHTAQGPPRPPNWRECIQPFFRQPCNVCGDKARVCARSCNHTSPDDRTPAAV